MALLQKQFLHFEKEIRLSDIDDNKPLRDKRDMLIRELQAWGKANDKPSFDWFNQGSYNMSTGTKPPEGDDHDIDVAIVYDINIDNYKDPVVLKKWVRDALNRKNRDVTIMTPCVRVQYREKGELKYHVDFAIYGKELNILGKEVCKYLSKGKEFAAKQNRFWEKAEPKKLRKLIKEDMFRNDNELGGKKRAQFRRVIRYFKRWKDHNFSSNGNARPTGISITAICYNWFQPDITKNWDGTIVEKDILVFQQVVNKALANNYGLDVRLPVLPHNPLFEKMKLSNSNVTNYKIKLTELGNALTNAINEPDTHEAAKILEKVLGEDFPVPAKEETAKRTTTPAITTSSASA